MIPQIANIKHGLKGRYLYIGRANAHYGLQESIFHNPFVIGKDGTREEVIEKFKQYAPTNKKLMDSLHLIDRENFLGCWCDYPHEDCHGRILIELREKQKMEQEKPKVKLAVIGSRGIVNQKLIFDFLDKNISRIEMIVSGGCEDSPDEIAEKWCKKRGIPILICYPDWDGKGKSAGFFRNETIIRHCDKVVAFHDGKSKGTLNSLGWAKKLNKPSKVIICD